MILSVEVRLEQRKHIYSIDAVRSFAMLGVMFFHLIPSKVSGGFLGVITFFVLSGYLSARTILQQGAHPNPWRVFTAKIRKLMPELITMVLLTVLVMTAVLSEYLPETRSQAIASVFGVNNIVQILDGESYFEAMASLKPFTHIWALSMELQFYAVFLFTFGFFYRKRHRIAWLIGLALAAVASFAWMNMLFTDPLHVTRIYYGTDTRMFSFLIGIIGALLFAEKKRKPLVNNAFHSTLTLGLLFVSVAMFVTVANSEGVYRYVFGIYSIMQMALLYLCTCRNTFSYTLLSNNVFKILADRSYSLYLWHFPVIKIYEKLMQGRPISPALYIALELLLVITVSEVFYQIFTRFRRQGDPRSGKKGDARRGELRYGFAAVLMAAVVVLLPYQPHGEGISKYEQLRFLKSSLSVESVEYRGKTPPTTTIAAPTAEVTAQTTSGSDIATEPSSSTGSDVAPTSSSAEDTGTQSADESASSASATEDVSITSEGETPSSDAADSSSDTSSSPTDAEADSGTASDAEAHGTSTSPVTASTARISNDETTAENEPTPKDSLQEWNRHMASTTEAPLIAPTAASATPTVTDSPEIAEIREIFEACRKDFPQIDITFEQYLAIRDRKITLIGDSISVMIANKLVLFFPNIEISAQTNRQSYHAWEFYEQLKGEGRIGETVILALGANGDISFDTFDKVREDIDKKPMIITSLILPWPVTEAERNEQVYEYAKTRKNIHVIKWNEHCKNMDGILYNDGVHPIETTGAIAYSFVIMEAVYHALMGGGR